ncbi:MAG: hypothetical protein ABR607_04730 [Pyrinomonadaceae bacterium]
MVTTPIIVRIVAAISDARATRNKSVITKTIATNISAAAVHATVAGVVAIYKHAAFPILIPWAAILSLTRILTVNEDVRSSAFASFSSASLSKSCG